LDFAGVEFCDSTGLAGLVRLRRVASSLGVAVRLVNAPPRMRGRLRMTGLDALFGGVGERENGGPENPGSRT
jgi:anti-anti-sigma factor